MSTCLPVRNGCSSLSSLLTTVGEGAFWALKSQTLASGQSSGEDSGVDGSDGGNEIGGGGGSSSGK